jgi:type II pantothenate kinase
MLAGLDLGASLHKVALGRDPNLRDLALATFAAADREAALRFIRDRSPTRVVITGGRADEAAAALAPTAASVVAEFDAWARGATLLAARAGTPVDEPYLLVSLGTGTSILLVADGYATRLGGTALGGGTLVGLGSLLLGVDEFDAIASLARRGGRREVDLLLGDVYPETGLPHATASHFGKVHSRRPEDLANAVVNLVAENVALMAAAHALSRGVATVVYGGSTLNANPALAEILTTMATYFSLRVVLLSDGAHCGAVGCLAMAFE